MKRRIAVLLALMLGISYCPSETVVMAAGDKEVAVNEKKSEIESNGLKNLQIPQKLNVVIDPWEMDQKGQIYSEEYIICNTGKTSGMLTLANIACKPREQSGVVVRTDKAGLHDSGDKAIYMEMLFGNGEQIIFSQESSKYQTELKPGEELVVRFAGEVNENAFGKWEDSDIDVSVVYSWETGEEINEAVEDVEESEQMYREETAEVERQSDTQDEFDNKEKFKEEIKTDLGSDEIEEMSNTELNSKEQESKIDANSTEKENLDNENMDAVQTTPADTSAGEVNEFPSIEENLDSIDQEEIKNIDLQEPQKVDVLIDSWKINEKGQIVSSEYQLQNSGSTTGIWKLSELVCKPQEQSGVTIKTDKEGLYDGEESSVYMELILGSGERIVLSQEETQYEVELKPGETLSIRFVGEMKGNLFETREEGDIAVTAVCTWSPE